MSDKPNMYVGMKDEMERIDQKIEDAVVAWKINEDGTKEVCIHHIDKALEIRDEVAELKGQLTVLIKGLDKNSTKLNNYQNSYNRCKEFLDSTRKSFLNQK